jgi:hypothetical protein
VYGLQPLDYLGVLGLRQEAINKRPDCKKGYMRVLNTFLTNPVSKKHSFPRTLIDKKTGAVQKA